MVDLTGACKVYLNRPQNHVKMYILMCLELPLKKLSLIPLFDYSTEALLLGLLTYSAQIGGNLQLIASDAGSQLGPFSNQCLGFNRIYQTEDIPKKAKIWADLVLGRRNQELREKGIFLKMVSNQHKSLNQIEACSALVKETLYSLNKNMQSTLSFYEWTYIMRLCEKAVYTRPLASSSDGKFFTPQYILSLLSQQGHTATESEFVPQAMPRSELVIADLENFEKRINKIRIEVAATLTSCLIEPAFFNTIVREEKIKNRMESEEIQTGSIMFCPKIYTKCFNVTRSLLRLVFMGETKQTGVFKKIGKWAIDNLVSRDFSDLFVVCKGNREIIFENQWKPTFQLSSIFQDLHTPKSDLMFGSDPNMTEIQHFLKESENTTNVTFDTLLGIDKSSSLQESAPELGAQEASDPLHEEEKGPKCQQNNSQVRTRYGRQVKQVERFQAK